MYYQQRNLLAAHSCESIAVKEITHSFTLEGRTYDLSVKFDVPLPSPDDGYVRCHIIAKEQGRLTPLILTFDIKRKSNWHSEDDMGRDAIAKTSDALLYDYNEVLNSQPGVANLGYFKSKAV